MSGYLPTRIVPLKICSKCKNKDIISIPNNKWQECYVCCCQKCGKKWYICATHNKRFGIKSFGRMNKHFQQYHAIMPTLNKEYDHCDMVPLIDNEICNEATPPKNDQLEIPHKKRNINMTDNVGTEIILHNKKPKLMNHNNTRKYFVDEIKEEGNGVCGMVGNAFQMSIKGTYASMEESLFHMELTNFLTKLTINQQIKVVSLINKGRKVNFQSTRIPKSVQDINHFYMTSKHSIYKNIPTPKVCSYDNHACVTIEEIIENVLALGLPLSWIKSSEHKHMKFDNSSLLKTRKAQQILLQTENKYKNLVDPYVIFLVIWSDDFEVNHTRKNKSSTWLKTVTFVNDQDDNPDDNQYTYALCLGNKKNSHFTVNKWYNEELIRLNEVLYKYSKIHSEYIPIVTRVLVLLADRPERCTLNDIASHSSNSTKRWMFSNGSNPHKMASCVQCFKKRVTGMFKNINSSHPIVQCNKCSDFDFSNLTASNAFKPPHNYPVKGNSLASLNTKKFVPPIGRQSTENLSNGYLYPLELTYETLTEGLKYALFNHLSENWNKRETVVYLKLLGIKDSTIQDMIDESLKNLGLTNDIVEAISKTEFPPMWSTVISLDQFVETPMHHLFEGLVKTAIELLTLFLKYHKKWTKFGRLINEIMSDVSSLHIGYCVVDTFSNVDDLKTGGWLAENYLGFSRVMVILIGHLDEFIDPNELGFIEIQSMFQTLFALLSILMTDEVYDATIIDNYIKLFLAVCHYYEKDIGFDTNNNGQSVFPFWYKKSNFVSLLNLTKQIEIYGPVRLHWEGLKEKFIQKVKPLLKNKRTRVSYLVNKLEKMHRNNNFEIIVNNFISDKWVVNYDRISDFQRFKSTLNTEACLHNFEALSGVVTKHQPNQIFIVHEINDEIQLFRLLFSDKDRFVKSNLWYYSVSLKGKPNYIFNEYSSLLEEIYDFVIVVPYHPGNTLILNGYTVISKKWNIYTSEEGFGLYQPNINFLDNMISKNS